MTLDCIASKSGSADTSTQHATTSCVSKCWCSRDFTESEIKAIIYAMRKTEDMKFEPSDAKKLDSIPSSLVSLGEEIGKANEKIADLKKSIQLAADRKRASILKSELTAQQSKLSLLKKNKDASERNLSSLNRKKNRAFGLFIDDNCPLPSESKTYAKLTTEINEVCARYEINTCIRKIHFLTQIYWESARMTTTLEFASGNAYNPSARVDAKDNKNTVEGDGPRYRGRGLMQLTWRINYENYFSDLLPRRPDLFVGKKSVDEMLSRAEIYKEAISQSKSDDMIGVDCAGIVASDIFCATDSAGWFWRKNKLNTLSDEVDAKQEKISKIVNGGGNGKAERKKYYFELKDNIFNYKNFCINSNAK